MLEQELQQLFEQRAAAAQPPVRASIAQAAQDGLALRRRRRLVSTVTPLLAACAVAAVAVVSALPHAQTGQHAVRPRPAASATPPAQVPRQFSPHYAYAAFGWLPAGATFTDGTTTPGVITLEADSTIPGATGSQVAGYSWRWSGYGRGACHLRNGLLTCGGQAVLRITGSAPDVNGLPAYWGYGPQVPGEPITRVDSLAPRLLAYHYAGSWASLSAPRASMFRVARTIRLVAPARIRYPVQIVGVPVAWQVAGTDYFSGPAGPETWDFWVRVSAAWQLAVNAGPGVGEWCEGTQADVAGHRVLLSRNYPGLSDPVTYDLCARNDHGTDVRLDETGTFTPGVIALFRSHLRLLGLDPANWTTQPLN
jgi:hypothetical protein